MATFGDHLKAIFDAHIADMSDKDNPGYRYSNKNLLEALEKVPTKWRPFVAQEFGIVKATVSRQILTCKHEDKKKLGDYETCNTCGATRHFAQEDPNTCWGRGEWGDWHL